MLEEYLEHLKNIKIKEFHGIRLDKVLFDECIYAQRTSTGNSVKKALFSIFEMNSTCYFKRKKSDLLLLTRDFHRNDHNLYWSEIKSLFDNYNEICIDYLEGKQRLKYINLLNIFKNVRTYTRFYLLLKCIENKVHRCYLSSVLTDVYIFKEKYLDKITPPKVVMTFFDVDPLESFSMQYFANKGSVTITNQHGYPIYRPNSNDLLNQSQIINLSSNYYLSKGEFTQKQFMAAGFDEGRIKIVGSLQDKKMYINNGKNRFAVFLDTPALEFGFDANKKMIQLASEVSNAMHYSFIVKMHPVDKNRELYERLLDGSLGRVAPQGTRNDEIYREIDFAIIHASSIYIDIIMEGLKMYKLEIGYDFPLVESQDDIICSVGELVNNYKAWLKKSLNQRAEYITSLQNYYSVDNARKNIKEFIEKFQ